MAEAAVIVVRLPASTLYRCTADDRVRRHAFLDSGCVDIRFVGRARLSQSLGGVIKFICVKIIAANLSYDLARVRIFTDHGSLYLRHLLQLDVQHPVLRIDLFDQKLGYIAW